MPAKTILVTSRGPYTPLFYTQLQVRTYEHKPRLLRNMRQLPEIWTQENSEEAHLFAKDADITKHRSHTEKTVDENTGRMVPAALKEPNL
jgi:hypothetical protein